MAAAIYAGSFDPITNGHVAIIRAGLIAFDQLIVAVLTNPGKQPMFDIEERVDMIRDAIGEDPRVEVDRFGRGLLVDYARSKDVQVILRGLRAAGDFEYELQMANMNHHLSPGIVTMFIAANDYSYVSSSLVKEVASLGGNLEGIVPDGVEAKLQAKLSR